MSTPHRTRRKSPASRIRRALRVVESEISDLAQGGLYAAGTASEGYAGGYAQALRDVELILNGVRPNTRDYWQDW